MDRFEALRIKSLENSIRCLRTLNQVSTLKVDIKRSNLNLINQYTDEIATKILDEAIDQKKYDGYKYMINYPELQSN